MRDDKRYIVEIKQWYMPRTTGPKSQNNHYHGHKTQIARYQGEDVDKTDYDLRYKAISRGWPSFIDSNGNQQPKPHNSERTTIDLSYLIDTTHEIADFLGLRLIEE
jgi:hypothetical protein